MDQIRTYQLTVPQDEFYDKPVSFKISDPLARGYPILWFQRHRDLIRLMTCDQAYKISLDGQEIQLDQLGARINAEIIYPRPTALMHEVHSEGDLPFLTIYDNCGDSYFFPDIIDSSSFGSPRCLESFEYMRRISL